MYFVKVRALFFGTTWETEGSRYLGRGGDVLCICSRNSIGSDPGTVDMPDRLIDLFIQLCL